MGVHLRLEYPHFRNLQPRYLTNPRVEELAWQVRLQLGCAETRYLKFPLDLLFSIDQATVNGLRVTFRWEIEEAIQDEQGVPVLGVCDCDPEEMPDSIMLSANSGMIGKFEALLRSVLVHELGHAVCDGPGWLIAYRSATLSGGSPSGMRALIPDERHLFLGGDAASKFAEFRANMFMGAFLVPQPLVLDPLRYYARKLEIPVIEAPALSARRHAETLGGALSPHYA